MASLSGVKAALRSMRWERSIAGVISLVLISLVLLAGLVERLAADAVEADFRGPGQHERATAAVAIDALKRETLQHRLPAAGADRLHRAGIGVLHHGVLGGIGAQQELLARVRARL